MERRAAGLIAGLGAYNLIQNLLIPERWYVPSNLAATGALVAWARRSGFSPDELGFGRDQLLPGLRVGTAAAVVAAAGVAGAAAARPTRHYLRDERSEPPVRAGRLARYPLGTALFEEVAFRGVLAGALTRSMPPLQAGLVSSAVFGLWHVVPTLHTLDGNPVGDHAAESHHRATAVAVSVATTGVAGLGFDWMRRVTGGVVAPWLAHAALNTVSYLAGVWAWRN